LLISLLVSWSTLVYLGAGHVVPYLVAVGLVVLLFPMAIGLNLAAKNMIGLTTGTLLVAVFVLTFSIAVPLVAVQKSYPVHCPGTFTEWQSISYYLFGFGSHFDLAGCS